MLADFFVANREEALRFANRNEHPDEGEEIERLLNPAQYKGITGLEIGTLWAILEGREWDVTRHVPEDIFLGDEDESWLHRFPPELANLLANSDDEGLASAAEYWAKTEELECDPADVMPLLEDLRSLARQASTSGKSVYLWGCL